MHTWLRCAGVVLVLALLPQKGSPQVRASTQAQPSLRRIGYLGLRPMVESRSTIEALQEGLRELGQIPGRDYVLEVRLAENDPSRYPTLITELTNLRVELIVAASTPAAVAIHRTNPNMPVVVGRGPDLVGAGLATTADRPGGVVTGIEELNAGNIARSVRTLKEVAPTATRVAVLSPAPTADAHEIQFKEAQEAAHELGIVLRPFRISATTDFDVLFSLLLRDSPEALLVLGGVLPAPAIERIVESVNRGRLPALYPHELYAERGGLLAYAMDSVAMFRHAATYVDKILRGAKPGDLPLTRWAQEPILYVNLRTAQTIGVTLPAAAIARAQRIIR